MRAKLKLSIVMTVYNGEKYIRESIDSILNQTFSEFELIIVDDGSLDSSIMIIEEYRDSRIKLIKNEINRGICYSSNRGISNAAGEYIARIDCDDICHRERFFKQVHFLDEHQEVFLCATWRNLLFPNGNRRASNLPFIYDDEIGFMLLFGNALITHSSVMFRKATYIERGYEYRDYAQAHDYSLWTQCQINHDKMEIIPHILVDYRINENGITVTNTTERNEIEAEKIKYNYVDKMVPTNDVNKNIKRIINQGVITENFGEFIGGLDYWANLFFGKDKYGKKRKKICMQWAVWEIIIRQQAYSLKLLMDYLKSGYCIKRKIFTMSGIKFVVKCLLNYHVKIE